MRLEFRIFKLKEDSRMWQSYHGGLKNIWLGTTVTKADDRQKAWDLLTATNKNTNKFLSIEPLLEEFDLHAYELLLRDYRNKLTIGNYLDWVIVGAQTGPNAVKPKKEWVESIINQCREVGVPVFLKDNLGWHEKIQEFPEGVLNE